MIKALLFADLHTNYKQLQNIKKFILDKKNNIGLIIFAGDVVNLGEPVGFMEQFIDAMEETMLPLIWVPGNNDFGRSYYKLNAKWSSVEGKVFEFDLRKIDKHYQPKEENEDPIIRFTGVGGSPASWSGQYAGESMIDRKKIGGTIFLSHFPPPGVRNYSKFDSDYSPSAATKKFSDSPLVHICAHLHHRWGVSYLGTTKVIQLAATELGYYAIMDLETLQIEFKRFDEKISVSD